MSHHAKPKHYLSAKSNDDPTGWVEGITSLKVTDPATDLLTTAATSNSQPVKMEANTEAATAAAAAGVADTGNASSAAAAAGTAANSVPAVLAAAGLKPLTPGSEEFQAAVDRALCQVAKELDEVGEVLLELGGPNGWGPPVMDSPTLATVIAQVADIAKGHGAAATKMRERVVQQPSPSGTVDCCVADVLVRKIHHEKSSPIEVRVAVIGNVDSGKSTMVGVLTRSILDDGRGLARSKVFKHHHEESTGRTSSIGQHTLCLDETGAVLNDPMFRTQTCGDYIVKAAKVITLVDLAGHEKYFRTTAFGLTGHMPDYACLIVGANMGVVGMCKEHMGVALALKVPVFFVITKVDIAPEHILKQTVQNLTTILKKPGVRKKPYLVRNVDDVMLCARNMHTDSLAPVFLTSAVTGKGLDLVRMFYNLLPQRQRWSEAKAAYTEFLVDETFGVPGVGTVVAGTVKKGIITPNMNLMLGPNIGDASFEKVAIKSIHYKRLPVHQVVAGQTAALALKKIKRSQVRKGMVLVDERLKPAATWEFDADIAILTHSTTIQPRYQAVIHCEIVRQAARVVAMDCERLRSGDRACVRFRFIQRPEYLSLNSRFVFREGRTKGIGIVIGTEHEQLPNYPPPTIPVGTSTQNNDQNAGNNGASTSNGGGTSGASNVASGGVTAITGGSSNPGNNGTPSKNVNGGATAGASNGGGTHTGQGSTGRRSMEGSNARRSLEGTSKGHTGSINQKH